ncbi:hypothetical protein [Paracoccus sp. MC1854]|uniref:hypothetical protein n=1 Tax=Paracoccus sp. MC1854 TaxID=2760306 RepID=UPI002105A6F2|nr:hypothetical protein [Paracoccus sp. MC1854]
MPFVDTREHARFSEFALACTADRYIGVCHGRPGVGKTRSARQYAACPNLAAYIPIKPIGPDIADAIEGCRGFFFTAPVSNTPQRSSMTGCNSISSASGMHVWPWQAWQEIPKPLSKPRPRAPC